jgi:hypothetical protein
VPNGQADAPLMVTAVSVLEVAAVSVVAESLVKLSLLATVGLLACSVVTLPSGAPAAAEPVHAEAAIVCPLFCQIRSVNVWLVLPALLVALTTTVADVLPVGVPLISPVLALMLSPAGRPVAEYAGGGYAVAVTCALNGVPTVP